MIGYLKKWKQGTMPLMLAMFIDLLEYPLFLSLAFQMKKVDIVSAMLAITKISKNLALLEKKPFTKLPRVKHLLSKCNQIDGENYYHFKASLDSLFQKEKKILRCC